MRTARVEAGTVAGVAVQARTGTMLFRYPMEPCMPKILLVEDQPTAAAYLARGLAEEGMAVDIVRDGKDGLTRLLNARYDLAILDVMLPGIDGLAVLEAARRAGSETPVLFLTSLGGVDNCVRALDLGAEDYLVKPLAFSELLARIRTILRRRNQAAAAGGATVFDVADLHVDVATQCAQRGGDRLDLAPKEFALLALLAQRSGEVQSQAVLAEQVWAMSADSDANIVEVAIRRLRAKLDDPYPRKLLHTVRGFGYVLEDRNASES